MKYKLRQILEKSVGRNRASSLLFSGGLDTSILAFLDPKPLAITVSFEDRGEDIKYAGILAKRLGLKHHYRIIKTGEAIEAIPEVIRILKSFDPAIPNDIAVYFGLKEAKELGINEIMTGDGSDEIFAGYSYMRGMKNLERYIRKLSAKMIFNSNILGESMNIKIKQPYLSRELLEFALSVPVEYKVKEGRGKWILRKAFEKDLPSSIIWQKKRPIEYGSGMTNLREIISSIAGDGEYPVTFINKEHIYYYRIYRDIFGEIPKPVEGEKPCPSCGGGMKEDAFHCRICGGLTPHILYY